MPEFKNAIYETPGCIICEMDEPDLIYSGQGECGFPVNICICKHCGFVYLNPRWNEETYFSFYQYAYDKYWRKNPSVLPPEKDVSSYYLLYQRLLNTFADFKPHNVLDIGSGNGRHLSYIMQQYPNAEYHAIESSASYKPEIEKRGIEFIVNDVNTDWDKSFEKKFDFVIMRHVLEHFLEPEKVLAKVQKTMTDDGILYIAVPDAMRNFILHNNFTVVHPYFFSDVSISNLLIKCGFEVKKMINAEYSGHTEMYLFAGKQQNNLKNGALNISSENYTKQKEVFLLKLKKEKRFLQPNSFWKLVKMIVRVKKFFFPQPILRTFKQNDAKI